jgi:hypothetical protein
MDDDDEWRKINRRCSHGWLRSEQCEICNAPKREWVGLTDEDFLGACQIAERGNYLVAFQRIQQILKAKNDH